jgi:hypothetical protein
MTEKNGQLKNLVDSSGYPFQIAIENEIRTANTDWKIITREHPWKNPDEETEGFIDLVLGHGTGRLVLECKRPRGGVWIFLISQKAQESAQRFKVCWAHCRPNRNDLIDWSDFQVIPESLESEFCVIRGHEDKAEAFLERLAKHVLSSIEALASEEIKLIRDPKLDKLRLFIPAIVTSAELKICRLNPNQISISEGTIIESNFETVQWVRFRKSLSVRIRNWPDVTDLNGIAQKKERSIYVINSLNLSLFLKSLKICEQAWGPLPWER